MFVRFVLILIAILIGSDAYAQSVRVIYFYPTDQSSPNQNKIEEIGRISRKAQSFYREQMEANGFGNKTFNLEGEGDSITIYIVKGNFNTEHYKRDRWEEIITEVTGVRSDINLVIVAGLTVVSSNAGALMQRSCLGNACAMHDFTYHAIVPEKADGVIPAVSHELGHAFGLNHNADQNSLMVDVRVISDNKHPTIDEMHLHMNELRWLDKHKYFNNDVSPNTPPTVKEIYDTNWVETGGFDNIMLRIDIEGEHELHQAQISRLTDGIVIGTDALMGFSATACFYFRKYMLKSDAYLLQIIDSQGNMRYVERININEPLIKSPQPIVGIKPGDIHSSVIIGWGELKE